MSEWNSCNHTLMWLRRDGGCDACDQEAAAARVKTDEIPPPAPELPPDVAHPEHYTRNGSGIECIQVTEHMNFCRGNAMKYLWRAGLKGDKASEIKDLQKSIWYIQREIDRLR